MVDGVIVTAAHNGPAYPAVVANHVNQCGWLVDVLLYDDGPHETRFYVSNEPVLGDDGPWPRRWMRIEHHNGFGAVFFHDDSTPPGEDWAWIAVNLEPLPDATDGLL